MIVPATATAARPAPSATQRSRCRSAPRVRRKRSTIATAPTGTASATGSAPGRKTNEVQAPLKPSTLNGLSSDWYGTSSFWCPITPASRKSTGPSAAYQAHQRQRGDGSVPVGVSSRTKPSSTGQGMKASEA